ncbi:MAG: glycosyltransferase family 2 protein [Prevotella sp.]|nr:glycosyltransferase family 2 protein [Prevotella sp.]MBR1464248.1 glycosyltransferase family 2 protein [Prevotella sp.]
MKKVTILIPCYNEEAALPLLVDALNRLVNSLPDYEWELLFVDDGSRDNTLRMLEGYHQADSRYCFVSLSRNFGKEAALLAGFDYARGDAVIMMDADLQDPPEIVPQMLSAWEDGYADVYGKRRERGKESWLRRRLTLIYYWLLEKSTRVQVLQNVGDFRLLDKRCIEELRRLRESERYTKGMYSWIGFKKKELVFDRHDRVAGKSAWNYRQLFALAIDGISSFSIAPLRVSTLVGVLVSLAAFLYMCKVLVKTLFWGDPVQGYSSLMVVMLFLGGIQLISLGIIGEYLGKTYLEVKNRPVYIVDRYVG